MYLCLSNDKSCYQCDNTGITIINTNVSLYYTIIMLNITRDEKCQKLLESI